MSKFTLSSGKLAHGLLEDANFKYGVTTVPSGTRLSVKQDINTGFEMVDHIDPMQIFMTFGQSNSGNGGFAGKAARKLTYPLFPYRVFGFGKADGSAKFVSGKTDAENGIDDVSQVTRLKPYQDFPSGTGLAQSQNTLNAFALEMAYIANEGHGAGIVTHLNFAGGTTIGPFQKGGNIYQNVVNYHRRAMEIAGDVGRSAECRAVLFMQGESITPNYHADLKTLADDMRRSLFEVTGMWPKFLVVQTNDADAVIDPSHVAIHQLYVANEQTIFCIAPMYQCKFAPDDIIHPDTESRMLLAEAIGEQFYQIIKTGKIEHMTFDATLDGNLVYAKYPHEITVDEDWVKPVPFYGFGITRNDIELLSAEIITGDTGLRDTVKLTFNDIPDNGVLTYGRNAHGDDEVDGWTNGRGMIYRKGRMSEFYKMGFCVPSHIRHYALKQQEVLF